MKNTAHRNSQIIFTNKYYEGDKIKDNEMVGDFYIVGKVEKKGSLGRPGRG
jgi:hypothetical protein